jgi:hypothetical protein
VGPRRAAGLLNLRPCYPSLGTHKPIGTGNERTFVWRPGGYTLGMSTNASTPNPNPAKDPEEWVTGDEPMTGPQASYLSTLAHEAGEDLPNDLTKAEASKRIDELQDRTGRGQ